MPRSALGWVLEAVSLAGLIAMFAYIAIHWAHFPGARTGLLSLPSLALVVYILLTIQAQFPRSMKLRFGIARDNPAAMTIVLEMLGMVKAIVVLTFAYIVWALMERLLGRSGSLGLSWMPFAVAAATLAPFIYAFKLRRYRKPR
jgi:hypothetical protein